MLCNFEYRIRISDKIFKSIYIYFSLLHWAQVSSLLQVQMGKAFRIALGDSLSQYAQSEY